MVLHTLKPRLLVIAPRFAPITSDSWAKWYHTKRWARLRWRVLVRDLFTCRLCNGIEPDTSQLVADHKQSHRGNAALFWDERNLQTLCKTCHDSTKRKADLAASAK